jgi:hypothetical protein
MLWCDGMGALLTFGIYGGRGFDPRRLHNFGNPCQYRPMGGHHVAILSLACTLPLVNIQLDHLCTTCQPVIGPLGLYLSQSAANNHVPCVTLAVVTCVTFFSHVYFDL